MSPAHIYFLFNQYLYFRFFNASYLQTTLKNGEIMKRTCLMYSESKGSIFCVPCLLFGGISSFATKGFSNWKKVVQRMKEHSNSPKHCSNLLTMKNRGMASNCVNHHLIQEIENEKKYWINVLKRIVAIVKSLASRGLEFRGHNSQIGSTHNGNFMMALELIAEFDPFLSKHIKKYGNSGKGNVSYISYHTYEQFINIMSKKVRDTIIQEVKNAKYFFISVDSTPDIAHVDQLSLVVRYVDSNGKPVERFLCFLDHIGHKAEHMATALISTIEEFNLKLSNLRGQSYDNASNMSGVYSGLQARIKSVSPLAQFVPCSAHSMNLVGTNAAICYQNAIKFFDLLQKLLHFFQFQHIAGKC